jgi:hypothetical protein
MQEEASPDFVSTLERLFKQQFPNGFFHSDRKRSLGGGGGDYLVVSLGMIGDIADVPNKIRRNDPLFHSIMINGIDSDVIDATSNVGSLMVNPTERHMAMGSIKTKFRKLRGDQKQVEIGFDRFFKKLRMIVDDNKADIYHVDSIDKKYL